jgi:hypothetical protein
MQMKNLKHEKETNSYMQLCLHMEGKGPVYLMVPTMWDDVHKQWLGFVQTPITRKLISGKGKTSKDLENDFNRDLHKHFEVIPAEALSMFKPLEYWESRL